ncbi:hypothetical protein Pint_22380 [Pistacia integerrima]|uniref:Uncharacterized protein n=1 Tax=Pistacia integerrima TaxID=434235 RepID=A0ACC0YKP7_9ROSI|nr:hypothetical protein Pint_22380 [Pistacia integerrima]
MSTVFNDRAKDVQHFDDTKLGVKGLVDAGITTIPGFFIHPPETLSTLMPKPNSSDSQLLPTIDLSGIMSNDEYKSVKHRVLANPSSEPRISTAVFFGASEMNNLYQPFPELISPEKPAHFQRFTYADYMRRFFTKELGGRSLVNYYRLSDASKELKSD